MKQVQQDSEDNDNGFRPRSVREVLNEWHHMFYVKISDATEVILRGIWPPINEMDNSLSRLKACVTLSLSKNMIEKISHLHGLHNLKVLSLAQNKIKSLNGLKSVSETLEVLIIARNFIKETKELVYLSKLKELDISYNCINEPEEFFRLCLCKSLKDLAFKENPFAEKYPADIWREEALKVLPGLEILDYVIVGEEERNLEPVCEFFKLKGNIIIDSPKYTEYNTIFEDIMNSVQNHPTKS